MWGRPPTPPGRVDLLLTEPPRQARWKVFFRFILAIPNAVLFALVAIVAYPLVVLNWCAALLLGRPWKALWEFLRGVLRWQARLGAYTYLLTAKYPPVSTRDELYPVGLSFEGPPQRVRRLAVLFRVLIALPAYVLGAGYGLGVGLLAVGAWACGVVAGRVPRSLHLILATALRYQLRLYAYVFVLTPRYPAGLLGDDRSAPGGLAEGTIVLGKGARGVAVAALVVGLLLTVADWGASVALSSRANTVVAAAELAAMSSRSANAMTNYRTQAAACGSNLPCVQRAMSFLQSDLSTQIATVGSIDFPTATSQRDATTLVGLLRQERSAIARLRAATSVTAFETEATQLQDLTRRVAAVANRLDQVVTGAHSTS
jgi:Domain of unknown function (DUF4389)